MKQRRIANSINVLHIDENLVSDPCLIQQAFLAFYSDILCCSMSNSKLINMSIINSGPILTDELRSQLSLQFIHQEIKEAMWSIPDGKAPGLDGYNSKFYKESLVYCW